MSKEPKYRKYLEGADSLSLGISIVVAILLGVGLGMFLEYLFESAWLLWLGVGWGVGGALMNIYKAYQKQLREFEELNNSEKERRDSR